MIQKFSIFILFVFTTNIVQAQNLNNVELPGMLKSSARKEIRLPDIPGYKTLKCDFHIHTVFSDGLVWPAIRVQEAWQEGLDAIAITDHIEYTPHSEYIKGDYNSSYNIARSYADQVGLILIKGGEITRSMPPGHFNAIFLKDVNALDTEEVTDALQEAADQGAFIFWNHPGWKAQQPDTCIWMNMHDQLYEDGLIHGIEVFNSGEYYPVAIDWCLEKDLAMLGNSDIHGVTGYTYNLEAGHRPVTLVFAKENSEESIKEALFANRSIAWFDDKLIGREEILKKFMIASLEMKEKRSKSGNKKTIKVRNLADMPFKLKDQKGNLYTIPALSVLNLNFPKESGDFLVTNIFTGTGKNLRIGLSELIE